MKNLTRAVGKYIEKNMDMDKYIEEADEIAKKKKNKKKKKSFTADELIKEEIM